MSKFLRCNNFASHERYREWFCSLSLDDLIDYADAYGHDIREDQIIGGFRDYLEIIFENYFDKKEIDNVN